MSYCPYEKLLCFIHTSRRVYGHVHAVGLTVPSWRSLELPFPLFLFLNAGRSPPRRVAEDAAPWPPHSPPKPPRTPGTTRCIDYLESQLSAVYRHLRHPQATTEPITQTNKATQQNPDPKTACKPRPPSTKAITAAAGMAEAASAATAA